ncbi:complex I subunit 5 family protein [Desulfoferrobacter suflitae]|uniref:complex I subunit 5 family protein n=1 Tax=Desulfoferrobacter suflitae TaxID=2865782 RepID=UPI002164430C|nr:proton-conducting transporter membrane subunit [Desulfoferrobacter suflitae]MCK8600344.1 hypothetical protein [Desulfoferrobacter suflitae]
MLVSAGAVSTLVCVGGLLRRVWLTGPIRHTVGGWSSPLGIELYADGLSTALLAVTAVIMGTAGFYVVDAIRHKNGHTEGYDSDFFWPLWFFLWTTFNAVFLSRDVFNLYITLELLVLCAVPLLILAGSGAALIAGMRYLLVAMLGSMCYLLGVALLYAQYDTLSIPQLGALMVSSPGTAAAVVLMTLGLLLKTALFPLHFWLPSAHGNAPAAVSALLSGLVVKASFYLLVRLWFGAFAGIVSVGAGNFLGLLGSLAIIWGSLLALRQQRLKLVIAYSTVAQIGYFFLLFPLVIGGTQLCAPSDRVDWLTMAGSGAMYFMLSHALAKAAMFLAAGCIAHAAASDRLNEVIGIGRYLPVSVFAFALAGVSLMGLPPSGGFVGKWMMLKAAFATNQWWWAMVISLGGLLAAAYVFMVLKQTVVFRLVDIRFYEVPRGMQWAALLLALFSLLLGVSGQVPLDLLAVGSPFSPRAGQGWLP